MLKERISGNYNAISIDRFSPKTKIRKYLWYFNDSLSCDPDFLLSRKDLFSSLENEKSKYSSTSHWCQCTKSCLEKNARILSKNPTTKENIRNFKPEIKPMM